MDKLELQGKIDYCNIKMIDVHDVIDKIEDKIMICATPESFSLLSSKLRDMILDLRLRLMHFEIMFDSIIDEVKEGDMITYCTSSETESPTACGDIEGYNFTVDGAGSEYRDTTDDYVRKNKKSKPFKN